MGLLTDPNASAGGLGAFLRARSAPLSWLLFAAGAAGLLAMYRPEYSHKTYFSENALLPGLVRGEFNEERAANRYLEDLREERKKYDSELPVPWLTAMFHQLGLEVYVHNFTLANPFGRERSFRGQNVYAILRAPRASSTEALVFSVPYRPPDSPEEGTDAAVATLLASARFFRKQYYWAKDLIFLLTEHEQLGMQAWLEAYHQRSCGSGVLDHGDLEARAGSIQAAVNLEIANPKITHFNIKIEGLNGQLPNLDLVNLVNRLCLREGVGQLFQGNDDPGQAQLTTMLRMAAKQATGIPSGNHGLFHRFGIEAVTMHGVQRGGRRSRQAVADLYVIGRVMEGVFRSLNNLLERFHQSFFFYLLPSSNRYVSIGMYMPAFGLLGGSLVLAALGMWVQATFQENDKPDREESKGDDDTSKSRISDDGKPDDFVLPVVLPSQLTSVLPLLLSCHFLGLVALYLPFPLSKMGEVMGWEAEDAIFIGLVTFFSVTALFLIPILVRLGAAGPTPAAAWPILKCLSLLELATVAFCLSLCNFSLAALGSVALVPFALLSAPSASALSKMARVALGLLVHPLALLTLACCVDSYVYTGVASLSNFADATKHALVFSIADGHIYGNFAYTVVTSCVLPCWLLFWSLNFMAPTGKEAKLKTD